MGELFLSKVVENIALVFRVIDSLAEQVFPCMRIALDARLVTSHDVFAAQFLRLLEQSAEFQILIAVDTRIRRDPMGVSVGELIDDTAAEGLFQIESIKRHAETFGNAAGIADIVAVGRWCFAPRVSALWASPASGVKELHRTADAFKTCFFCKFRGDG